MVNAKVSFMGQQSHFGVIEENLLPYTEKALSLQLIAVTDQLH